MEARKKNIKENNFCMSKQYFDFPKVSRHNWEITTSWKNNLICHLSGLVNTPYSCVFSTEAGNYLRKYKEAPVLLGNLRQNRLKTNSPLKNSFLSRAAKII